MTNTGNELTSLFEVPTAPEGRGFPAFAISTTLHGIGIAMVAYVLIHAPVIKVDPLSRQYKMRHLDFQMPETAASRAAEKLYPHPPLPHPKQPDPARQSASGGAAAEVAQAEPKPRAVPALNLPDGGEGKQILVQPEIHTHIALAEETPVPTVMTWKPEATPTDHIVLPKPAPVTTADVQTSIQLPNEEMELANLPAASSKLQTQLQTPPAGSTSPVAMKTPSTVKTAPATASVSPDPPTAAAVLSASDLRMNQGTVMLPPVNETRGTAHNNGGAPQSTSVLGAGSAAGSAGMGGAEVGDAQQAGQNASAQGETAEHIQLPPNGRFGVVVVGSSLADQYPETLQIWSDRVAYTAYLHVGTPKAWILQYAQLRSADAAAGGSVAKLEAPWPYDIQRPNLLSRDVNADALMVRGVLNESGRLEQLAIAYPQGYVHSSFVLRELAQWQFRPARQLGKATPVEVLLIIPEDLD